MTRAPVAPRTDGLREVRQLVQGVRSESRNIHSTPLPKSLANPLITTQKPLFVWEQPSPGMTRLISRFSVHPAVDAEGECFFVHEDVCGGYASAYWSPHETRMTFQQGLNQLLTNFWGTDVSNRQQIYDLPREPKTTLKFSNIRQSDVTFEWLSSEFEPNLLRAVLSLPLFKFREEIGGRTYDTAVYAAWLAGERRWLLTANEVLEAKAEPDSPERKPDLGEYVVGHNEVYNLVTTHRETLLDPIFAPLHAAREE